MTGADARAPSRSPGRPWRSAGWGVAALAANLACAGAFLWLPWAEGRGALAGPAITGPELVRLARSADVLWGGPAGLLLTLALYLVPVAALAAAVLLLGARFTPEPARAARLAAHVALAPVGIALLTKLAMVAGAGAPRLTDDGFVPGSGLAIVAGAVATLAARRAAGR